MAQVTMQEVTRRTREEWCDLLLEGGSEETIFLDGFNTAILGIVWNAGKGRIAYSYAECIESIRRDGLDAEGAEEHFEYNVRRTVEYLQLTEQGDVAPIIIDDV